MQSITPADYTTLDGCKLVLAGLRCNADAQKGKKQNDRKNLIEKPKRRQEKNNATLTRKGF